MTKPTAGLLPLYLELYDQRLPDMRKVLDPFRDQVADGLRKAGLNVVVAPVVRTREEAFAAVDLLQKSDVDAIVTLHLAYSPSLSSADALASSDVPLILCDTTMDHGFGRETEFGRMLYNHGIHGVQDLASVLRRMGRHYQVVAGHVSESDVLSRTAKLVYAAHAAGSLTRTRALRIGRAFEGMGDFAVDDATLGRSLGVHVDQIQSQDLVSYAAGISDTDIEAELAADRANYNVTCPEDVHRRTLRVSLALRRCLEQGRYGAFSMNFSGFDSSEPPINAVPFMECSKAMARGIGYAGEGDVLTASLVGALASTFGETTFTEIFCPDWKGNSLFLSHMGEINPAIASGRPLLCEKPYKFSAALNPAIIACAPREGPAVLVNLAPGPEGELGLIIAPVEVLGDAEHPSMREQIRGWVRPQRDLADFLETYSHFGGTHHSALVMNGDTRALAAFGDFCGFQTHILQGTT